MNGGGNVYRFVRGKHALLGDFLLKRDRVKHCECKYFYSSFCRYFALPAIVQKYCRLHHFSSTPFLSTEKHNDFFGKKIPAFILCENNGRRPQTFHPPRLLSLFSDKTDFVTMPLNTSPPPFDFDSEANSYSSSFVSFEK